MRSAIELAGELVCRSAYTVALTGAGISTPSGIPDFRSPSSGLWSYADPLEVASIWAFNERPEGFYRWFEPMLRRFAGARPNMAHRILAEMQARGNLSTIITQNIDSLHQEAGSNRVLEVHGHSRTATCLECGTRVPAGPLWPPYLATGEIPRCPDCRGILKPDVILFGEPLPYEILLEAQQEALRCEVMLVIGTSLEVMPAADLPLLAHRRGARVILINLAHTTVDDQFDLVIHADVERTLVALWRVMQK
jgi:NAD-dependent deacetylase